MKFDTHIDRRIFKAIQGSTARNSQTLMDTIGGVDSSERLVLTYDELSGRLQRLVDAGHIAEVEPHRFCDASNADCSGTFSGITESDDANAVQKYHDWFQQQLNNLDDEPGEDDFVWRKLVLRWTTPEER